MRVTDSRRWSRHGRMASTKAVGVVDYPGLAEYRVRSHCVVNRVFVKPSGYLLDSLWLANVHIALYPFIWLALNPDMVGAEILAWAFACVAYAIRAMLRAQS